MCHFEFDKWHEPISNPQAHDAMPPGEQSLPVGRNWQELASDIATAIPLLTISVLYTLCLTWPKAISKDLKGELVLTLFFEFYLIFPRLFMPDIQRLLRHGVASLLFLSVLAVIFITGIMSKNSFVTTYIAIRGLIFLVCTLIDHWHGDDTDVATDTGVVHFFNISRLLLIGMFLFPIFMCDILITEKPENMGRSHYQSIQFERNINVMGLLYFLFFGIYALRGIPRCDIRMFRYMTNRQMSIDCHHEFTDQESMCSHLNAAMKRLNHTSTLELHRELSSEDRMKFKDNRVVVACEGFAVDIRVPLNEESHSQINPSQLKAHVEIGTTIKRNVVSFILGSSNLPKMEESLLHISQEVYSWMKSQGEFKEVAWGEPVYAFVSRVKEAIPGSVIND